MTREEYRALRDTASEMRLQIARLIESAGANGWETLEAFEAAQLASQSAWRDLSHEDRMAVMAQENAERDALLAKLGLGAVVPA